MKLSTIIAAARNSVPEDSEARAQLLSEIDCVTIVPEYAEPGYSCAHGVALGNWNEIHARDQQTRRWDKPVKGGRIMRRLERALERAGYSIEWSDEWAICADCGGAVRTSPDCWFWSPYYRVGDGEILCLECAPNPEDDNE